MEINIIVFCVGMMIEAILGGIAGWLLCSQTKKSKCNSIKGRKG